MPAETNKLFPSAAQIKDCRLLQPLTRTCCSTCPLKEKRQICPADVRVAATRAPSGERSRYQLSSFATRANRKSSRPRPLVGSKTVTAICLPSSIGSPITQNPEGDLAQVSKLQGLAMNNRCDGPPVTEARVTGSGPFPGGAPFSPIPR